jgi:hypothetical protein
MGSVVLEKNVSEESTEVDSRHVGRLKDIEVVFNLPEGVVRVVTTPSQKLHFIDLKVVV